MGGSDGLWSTASVFLDTMAFGPKDKCESSTTTHKEAEVVWSSGRGHIYNYHWEVFVLETDLFNSTFVQDNFSQDAKPFVAM